MSAHLNIYIYNYLVISIILNANYFKVLFLDAPNGKIYISYFRRLYVLLAKYFRQGSANKLIKLFNKHVLSITDSKVYAIFPERNSSQMEFQ